METRRNVGRVFQKHKSKVKRLARGGWPAGKCKRQVAAANGKRKVAAEAQTAGNGSHVREANGYHKKEQMHAAMQT